MTRTHPVTARRNGGCTPINELGVGYMASWQVKLALVERVDLGQGNRQVSAKLHGKNITLDQVVKTAGEAVWSSPL